MYNPVGKFFFDGVIKKIKKRKIFSKKALTNKFYCDIISTVVNNAPLAQLVEQLTLNQWVPGSNP